MHIYIHHYVIYVYNMHMLICIIHHIPFIGAWSMFPEVLGFAGRR